MADRLLLVEGEADRAFFELLCRKHTVDAEAIKVSSPKGLGGDWDSKQGVLNLLEAQISDLNDGRLQALAIVVDADRAPDGGFAKTIQQITVKVTPQGYGTPPVSLVTGGLLYKHNDGLPDLGVWVMPDNKNEGMLEDWIKQSVSTAEQGFFTQAQSTVANLVNPKFGAPRVSKAEVATWLAWQKQPGEGLYCTVKHNLLDSDAPLHTGLVQWLKTVFP
ncbi:DUF3226 domain-containing protein [Iodobacter ciconiae]|uniref:DUF4276 family protein n=1 Tax=Iodobacter ciconiae TaxID=2496266 RepID=A0A3S8ZQW8_9NEIS|nr:DUF3226 domain-containing protein [Iodobacter ciconiae]AZN35876.1 hypothetical protein EJO50_04885 [Iodobacter ciconiae]